MILVTGATGNVGHAVPVPGHTAIGNPRGVDCPPMSQLRIQGGFFIGP
jgi:hypothetical protein